MRGTHRARRRVHRDGPRVLTRWRGVVHARRHHGGDAGWAHVEVIRRLDAPPGTFVAVAPGGALLFADEANASDRLAGIRDRGPRAGRSPSSWSTPTWTADGALGHRPGRDGALFHVWREQDGAAGLRCRRGRPTRAAIQKAAVSSPNGAATRHVHADGPFDVARRRRWQPLSQRRPPCPTGLVAAALDWGLAVSDDGTRVGRCRSAVDERI